MKTPKLKFLEPIEIIFTDPTSHNGWYEAVEKTIPGLIQCFTIGYYLCHDKEKIALCMIKHNTEVCFADIFVVPLGCVKSIKRVK